MLNIKIKKRYEYKNGYVKLKLENGKVVDEHRYNMTNHLNRELTYNEVVHHIDGNKSNNNINNLELKTRKQHSREHIKCEAKQTTLICKLCGKTFERPTSIVKFKIKNGQDNFYCTKSCQVKQQWNDKRKGVA